MSKKYIYIAKQPGEEVFFQLEDSFHIYKGIVVGGKLNLFKPSATSYTVEVTDIIFNHSESKQILLISGMVDKRIELPSPSLNKKDLIDIDILDMVYYVSDYSKTTPSSNFNKETIYYYSLMVNIATLSYRKLSLFKEIASIQSEIIKINSIINKIDFYELILSFSCPFYKKEMLSIDENSSFNYKKSQNVYVFDKEQITIKSLFNLFLDFKHINFEGFNKIKLNYLRFKNDNGEIKYTNDNFLTFGLIGKDNKYVEYKRVFKNKTEIISYISSLDKI